MITPLKFTGQLLKSTCPLNIAVQPTVISFTPVILPLTSIETNDSTICNPVIPLYTGTLLSIAGIESDITFHEAEPLINSTHVVPFQ
jgi:hypothetical protein